MSDDLDKLILKFQNQSPTSDQLIRWTLAAQKANFKRRGWLQISAGLAAGIILGLLIAQNVFNLKHSDSQPEFVATYTEVSVKDF